ncbi:hypothetical protein GQ457_02G025080 [Hibiscus cannabinus]
MFISPFIKVSSCRILAGSGNWQFEFHLELVGNMKNRRRFKRSFKDFTGAVHLDCCRLSLLALPNRSLLLKKKVKL